MTRKQLIELLQAKPKGLTFIYRIIGDPQWRNPDGSPADPTKIASGVGTLTFQDLEDMEAVKQLLNNNLN